MASPFKPDAAVENSNLWREQHYLRFRWTPKTARAAILGVVVFPIAVYSAVNYTTSRWSWNAKLKGQSLAK
ncbi:hypothetical protein GYMLUDRAFT_241756 [Collybiopsis luxurians FD-317 M1]|uniref:NADH-ubiquinone oxidoreductase B15 subunit n=1 Tax=Collybiopsis luxurians FD-317 M1 TaxID=944289 RepID=A0A0D0C6S5_9AGAR|nr:hypothetical protein GYMLUDRAFT_241756 [Collybiopsis luxurians FD-317 M1]